MSYPTSPVFSGIKLKSHHYNVRSESIAGRSQSRSLGGQRWEFSAKYPVLTREQFQPVFAYSVSTGGTASFVLTPPVISDKSGDASGSGTVDGGQVKGDSTIVLQGLSGTLKAGDMLAFSNHTKVYMITADKTGSGIVNIAPALVGTLTDNELVTFDAVPFTVRMKNDVQEMTVRPGQLYTYEIDFIEVV